MIFAPFVIFMISHGKFHSKFNVPKLLLKLLGLLVDIISPWILLFLAVLYPEDLDLNGMFIIQMILVVRSDALTGSRASWFLVFVFV